MDTFVKKAKLAEGATGHPSVQQVTFIARDPVKEEDELKTGLLVNFGLVLIRLKRSASDFTVMKTDTVEMVCHFVEQWTPGWGELSGRP